MNYRNNSLSRLSIKILFIFFSSTILISCKFITEPEPFFNKEAVPAVSGVSLRYYSGEICTQGDSIVSGTSFWLVLDSSNVILTVTGILMDSVALERVSSITEEWDEVTKKWAPKYKWVYSLSEGSCTVHVSGNVVQFRKSGEFSGSHTVQINYNLYNSNSGLSRLSPGNNSISINLHFL